MGGSQRPPSPGGGGSAAKPPGRGDTAGRLAAFRRQTAKRLRANTTEAERKLWRALKAVPVEGTHFRKQVPIGPYVADFACLAARLVIELDGGHHSRDHVARKDQERQHWLEREGFRVLRFWDSEASDNREGVLDTIYHALYGALDAEGTAFVHVRRPRPAVSPHPAGCCAAADPPPPGEGRSSSG